MEKILSIFLQWIGFVAVLVSVPLWYNRLLGAKSAVLSQGRYSSHCSELLAKFSKLLTEEIEPFTLYDEGRLPMGKSFILAAFKHELSWEVLPERISALQITALELAQFQPGIGDKPIHGLPYYIARKQADPSADDAMTAINKHSAELERFAGYQQAWATETQQIAEQLAKAAEAAKSRSLLERAEIFAER